MNNWSQNPARLLTDVEVALDNAALHRSGLWGIYFQKRAVELNLKRRAMDFAIEGRAGELHSYCARPGCLFRGDTLVACESKEGGTEIRGVFVGSKPFMWPTHAIVRTASYVAAEACRGALQLDTCDPTLFITIQVYFLVPCTWSALLIGDAHGDLEPQFRDL